MKYIALLRGINVGGNNKVSMSDLKTCFESAGFQNVTTYINSGNVIFDSEESALTILTTLCTTTFENFFHFSVSITVLTADDLREALAHAPDWWNADKTSKHNAIFIISAATAAEIIESIGSIAPEYEKVAAFQNVIFWSAPIQTFSHTRWSKVVGTPSYKFITIRNANTTKKLLQLAYSPVV